MLGLAWLGLAWLVLAQASVLVPTYVLPPAAFRDPRSLPPRTLARLAGGHLRLPPLHNATKDGKADHAKNSFAVIHKDVKDHDEKDGKNYDDKFAGVVVKQENVGWNQGQWDDGMLMSSAGNGKEKSKKGDVDEDKKTLADQVAEGKYGLIQKELFLKMPTRPGVISYAANPETEAKDNEGTLGGLKNEDIWLAEDQLLVLRGGALGSGAQEAWPPIDDYRAPPRQVKVPPNPRVPPPFPVRLSDGGPLVFLTPNGSVPAPLFPSLPPPAGLGALPAAPPARPAAAAPPRAYPGDLPPGGAPLPGAALPAFPFFPPTDGSLAGGNVSELYDEDDPSIYYPPPYSFSYRADNSSRVAAGPLVPGIVLPPPPDFFGPLEPTAAAPVAHAYPATSPAPPTAVLRPRPAAPTQAYLPAQPARPLPESPDNSLDSGTPPPKTVTITSRPRQPERVVVIAKAPARKPYSPSPAPAEPPTPPAAPKARPAVTVLHKQPKTTLKPVSGSLYDYPEKSFYDGNSVTPSPRPFLVYGPPERTRLKFPEDGYVTSTPVPLRAYYSDPGYDGVLAQVQFKQNGAGARLRPDFYHNSRQNGKSVASFYFYEEPAKAAVSTPAPAAYFDGRNYYHSVGANAPVVQDGYYYNQPVQSGFAPASNLEYRPVPSRDPSPFFFIPQRQGSRTLTQEYFSVQKPKAQNAYIQQAVPAQPARQNGFYDQIANIKQTIDYYTTHRPKVNLYQPNPYREVRPKAKPTPRPVYQFSFQNNNARPEHNTFRAPKMDDTEPFRPMVAYSEPYEIKEEYASTPKNAFSIENQRVTTESPQPAKFYSTVKPEDYDYEDASRETKNTVRASHKPSAVTIRPHSVTPASALKQSHKVRGPNPTTRNPVNHAYYTKQEEGLFDDITKNYFTIFGQKIEPSNSDGVGIAVTAPIRPHESSTIKTPIDNNINIRYSNDDHQDSQQPIISLASDTQVNYRQPRPLINPDSEFIPIVNPQIQAKYEAEQQIKQLREQISQRQRVQNVEIIKSEGVESQVKEGQQFAADQLEYYRPVNQGGQALQSLQRGVNGYSNNAGRQQVAEGRPGSLIAYRLPGEGAHVYFLTPQPARPDTLKYRTAEEIAALS